MTTPFTLRKLAFTVALSASGIALNAQTVFFSWADQFGSTGYDYASAMAIDNLGNQYTTGMFRNTVDFDPGSGTTNLTSSGAEDVFVLKTDAFGALVWAVRIGGTGADIGNEIAVDANGNVYIAGDFESTVDFDPGAGTSNLSSPASASGFLLRLSPTGTYDWAIAVGSTMGTQATGLCVDASGVSHLAGLFTGNVDLDPGAGTQTAITAGQSDLYIMEISASGTMVWAEAFGGTSIDRIESIAQDVNGDLYITGFFMGTCDFEPGGQSTNLTSNGSTDIFLAKYNGTNGNLVWAEKIGGSGNDGGTDLACDFSGNVYATGYFEGTADFDPGSGSTVLTAATGISDAFVVSLSTTGTFAWAGEMGGNSVDAGQSICLDITGNVYTTGRFSGTADFDPSAATANVTSSGTYDVYISKLNSSGVYQWAHHIGGPSNDVGNAIGVDATYNVFCTGYFAGSADLDPQASQWGVTSNGQDDMMLVKFSQSGVGIDEATASHSLEVYPNPANGPVTIVCNGAEGMKTVRIISVTGEVVSQHTMNGTSLNLDLSGLARGTYFVEVKSEGEVMITQLIH